MQTFSQFFIFKLVSLIFYSEDEILRIQEA